MRKDLEKQIVDIYISTAKKVKKITRCSKCLLPETMPYISFDKNGVCNYCHNYKKKKFLGEKRLLEDIKKARVGLEKTGVTVKYDCLVSFSGGRDSSFMLHYLVKKLGLKPLVYTYDWSMLTPEGEHNLQQMIRILNVEHILIKPNPKKKLGNIRKNINAWLESPHLGLIPLFMAGDKQFFIEGYRIRKREHIPILIAGENYLEKTDFKNGFAMVRQEQTKSMAYNVNTSNKLKLIVFYLKHFLSNTKYLNSSLWDSFTGFISFFVINHDYINFYDYVEWSENEVNNVLLNKYGWIKAKDADTTWRIGDGTAAFYNYLYYVGAGFTENDTFRSNQIRMGAIERDAAIKLVEKENYPRLQSLDWYANRVDIDLKKVLDKLIKL